MCTKNFRLSGCVLHKIWSRLYPRFGKWPLLGLFVWVSVTIEGLIFFETACIIIHKTLPFTIYIKLSKIWRPRLSKLGRGLPGMALHEKTATFGEKYQTSPIPNIHWWIQVPPQEAMVFITRHGETINSWKNSCFWWKIPNLTNS